MLHTLLLLTLFLSEAWYFTDKSYEPVIVFLGTLVTYLAYLKNNDIYVDKVTLSTGIDKIFQNEDEASQYILDDIQISKKIKILSIRGNRITNEERQLSKIFTKTSIEKEILLSSTASKYLQERARDFDNNGLTYNKESYLDEVNLSINKIQNIANNTHNKTKLYLHTLPETFRLFFTETHLYLSFFNKGESASKSRVFRIQKDCELFHAFSVYFEWVKNDLALESNNINQNLLFLLEKSNHEEKLKIIESLWIDIESK